MTRNRRFPPGYCDECGALLVCTLDASSTAPAEYGCPVCEGGVRAEEVEHARPLQTGHTTPKAP